MMNNKLFVPADPNQISETGPPEIDAFFNALEPTGITQMVVYSHGGLTDAHLGEKTADRLTTQWAAPHRRIVNIVWESGALDTFVSILKQNVSGSGIHASIDLVRGWLDSFQRSNVDIAGLQAAEMLEDASPRPPHPEALSVAPDNVVLSQWEADFIAYIEGELAENPDLDAQINETFGHSADEVEVSLDAPAQSSTTSENTPVEAAGLGEITLPRFRVAKAGVQVAARLATGRDHGLLSTIIEELFRASPVAFIVVKELWDDMKFRAEKMWHLPSGPKQPAAHFLTRLLEWKQADPNRTIDLIGHSAGAIVLCHLMREAIRRLAREQQLFRNISFLAPAATMSLFDAEVATKLGRYQRFRMFTMSDANEQKDVIHGEHGPPLYDKSLLYFVSGVLEREPDCPLAGMSRFFSGKKPFDSPLLLRAFEFYAKAPTRIAMSVTLPSAPFGQRTTAKAHGEFDDEQNTLESIKEMLNDI